MSHRSNQNNIARDNIERQGDDGDEKKEGEEKKEELSWDSDMEIAYDLYRRERNLSPSRDYQSPFTRAEFLENMRNIDWSNLPTFQLPASPIQNEPYLVPDTPSPSSLSTRSPQNVPEPVFSGGILDENPPQPPPPVGFPQHAQWHGYSNLNDQQMQRLNSRFTFQRQAEGLENMPPEQLREMENLESKETLDLEDEDEESDDAFSTRLKEDYERKIEQFQDLEQQSNTEERQNNLLVEIGNLGVQIVDYQRRKKIRKQREKKEKKDKLRKMR